MKLQPSEVKKTITSCKNCIFSSYESNTQTGCDFNRTEKFKELGCLQEAYDNEKEFFIIDRICNLYRTESWKKDDFKYLPQHARKEVKPKFGIVILDTNEPSSQLDKAIDSIFSLNYNPQKVKVVISTFHDRGIEYLVRRTEELKREKFVASFVVNYTNISQMIEYDAFRRCGGANYLVKMEHDSILNSEILNKVDESLNENLEQIALFESGNVSIVQFHIANTQYPNYNNFRYMVDNLRSHGKMYKTI
jgi:hypothetical protein